MVVRDFITVISACYQAVANQEDPGRIVVQHAGVAIKAGKQAIRL
jgi:hypothetical protein